MNENRCFCCRDEIAVEDVLCVYCEIILERCPEGCAWQVSPYGPLLVGVDVPVPEALRA
jgi:hypothetical protein